MIVHTGSSSFFNSWWWDTNEPARWAIVSSSEDMLTYRQLLVRLSPASDAELSSEKAVSYLSLGAVIAPAGLLDRCSWSRLS